MSRSKARVTQFTAVPAQKPCDDGYGTVQTKNYRHLMQVMDDCVALGGWFTGHSEYLPVHSYAGNHYAVEHLTVTLHWPDHPQDILRRGPK